MTTAPTPKPIVDLVLLLAVVVFISQLTACGGSSPQPPVPALTSVQLFPATSTIDIGQIQQFTAWGTYSDGLSQDISSQVTWSSSNQTVATISSSGLALGNSQGSSTISATFNSSASPVTGTTALGVAATLTSLTITPVNPSIAISTSLQLTATGIFSDGSTQDLTASVSWSSLSSSVATVNNSGVVTGMGAGNTTITATQGGVSAATTVIVTSVVLTAITITPPNVSIAKSTSEQLIATGDFSDGTTQNLTAFVTWVSSAPSVAAVSNTAPSQGVVTGDAAGSATITATLGGVSGATAVTVTSAVLTSIVVTPTNPSIARGSSLQLTATGVFSDRTTQNLAASVSWISSANPIATVSSSGVVGGTGVGSATITATEAGVSGTTTVTVTGAVLTAITITPPDSSIAKGISEQLIATGDFSDGTTQNLTAFVTWASAAPSLATVSDAPGSQGLVTGIGVGSATITATLGGVSGATTVTVTAAVLTSIAVTPANPSIANGTTVHLTATGTFSDGTTQDLILASWISSSDTIATVANTGSPGLVTGTGVGSATITATRGGVSGTTTVTVTAAVLTAITITPPNTSIATGISVQLIATGDFSDGTTQNLTAFVTWVSSAPSLATVSNAPGSQGLVTGIGVGSATITATLGGVSGATTVTVTAAVLTSIAVTPANPSIANGTTVHLTATGTFSDGTTQDLILASWISSSDTIATVANTGSPGLVTGTGVGSATITATRGGVSGTTTVTVTPAVLTSIAVTPANLSIANGTTVPLTAMGTFSDSTTQDLTASASWTSSSERIATVTNEVNPALVTGTGIGSATIIATEAGVSGTATVTVTAAVLTSIAVTPANPSIANGTTAQLTATGTFSDGTTQDLILASWISSSDTIATVANTVNPGLVTGTGIGSATITATRENVSGATTVSVEPVMGTWTPFGSLSTPRKFHTASLRPDGTVLVAGGQGSSGILNSVEISDPVTETWNAAPPMTIARLYHTSTTLQDGRVLVAGGLASDSTTQNSAEIFSTLWSAVAPMTTAREAHTATLLNDGRVLVVGGNDASGNPIAITEVYNPNTGIWTLVASLNTARANHTATLLADGRVLVAGGDQGNTVLASAEVYDPTADTWTVLPDMSQRRAFHTASLLPDGSVLVAGGSGIFGIPTGTAELFHPQTMSWQPVPPMETAREYHTATLMLNGQVVVAGGTGQNGLNSVVLSSVEIFDPSSMQWLFAASMANARTQHTATLMPDGRLLVVGGVGTSSRLGSSELFNIQ